MRDLRQRSIFTAIRAAGLPLVSLLLIAGALSCGEDTREPDAPGDSRPADRSVAAGGPPSADSSDSTAAAGPDSLGRAVVAGEPGGPSDSAAGAEPAVPSDPLEGAADAPEVSLDSLGEICRASPDDFEACRRYLLESLEADDGPECLAVLRELEAGHAAAWVPPYLIGEYHQRREETTDARVAYETSLDLARRAGIARGEVESLTRLARLAALSEDTPLRARLLEEALARAREAGEPDLTAMVLYKIAFLHRQEGRFGAERDVLTEVAGLLRDQGNTRRRRVVLYSLANLQRKYGRLDEAARGFKEVQTMAREADDPDYLVSSRIALGVTALDAADPERALPLFDNAAAVATRAGREDLEIHADILAGVALMRIGRLDKSRQRLESSLSRARETAENLELRALIYLADVERRSERWRAAEDRYRRAQELTEKLGMPEERWEAQAGLASLYRDLGDHRLAVEYARRAEAVVETLRESISEFRERTHFLQARSEVYAVLASCLAESANGELTEVFDVFERAHSRALRESLVVTADVIELTAGLEDVQRQLAPGDLLVSYLLGDEQSLLITIGREEAVLHRLAPRSHLDRQVEAYRQVLTRPLASVDARLDPEADFRRLGAVGHDLFQELLGPLAERLATARRLIVVPDRQLHRLPFEALVTQPILDGESISFLGQEIALQYLPAAAFLASGGAPSDGRVLVISAANAGRDLGMAPLRHAAAETAGISGAYLPGSCLVLDGPHATVEQLQSVESTGTLHLIAHATLEGGAGPRILVESGTPDGPRMLDAAGIQALAPAPDLVVLSACETAEGELVGGEGILGLVRAFTLAGSSQVVASLWKVDDAASASLMIGFHRALAAGERPSDALHAARRDLLATEFRHPFAWAGFVLYGAD